MYYKLRVPGDTAITLPVLLRDGSIVKGVLSM